MTFWSLGVYDINVPTASYEKQVSQLNNQITSIEDNNLVRQLYFCLPLVWLQHHLVAVVSTDPDKQEI